MAEKLLCYNSVPLLSQPDRF